MEEQGVAGMSREKQGRARSSRDEQGVVGMRREKQGRARRSTGKLMIPSFSLLFRPLPCCSVLFPV